MSAEIIDGKKIAATIKEDLKQEIDRLSKRVGRSPGLAVILVGDNPASKIYVKNKRSACEELGIHSEEYSLDQTISEEELIDIIEDLNKKENIDGILVQSPLPDHLDENKIAGYIDQSKDVDGFHPINVGKLLIGEETFISCTPFGIQQLLLRSGVKIEGKHVVIVGRSTIVGKPLAALLMQKKENANATVTVCHSRTRDLAKITRQADILIAALGSPKKITADMVSKGAVVIDVGINRIKDPTKKSGYRLVGDVDFDNVSKIASKITPVPGGVGPMTIAMLMYNTVKSYKLRERI